MTSGDMVYVRRVMNYGGANVDQQQVIELKGLLNDQKLLDLGMVVPIPEGTKEEDLVQCGRCGARFLNESARERHGNLRHAPQVEAPKPPDWHEADLTSSV